jgi:hypothetical protein
VSRTDLRRTGPMPPASRNGRTPARMPADQRGEGGLYSVIIGFTRYS